MDWWYMFNNITFLNLYFKEFNLSEQSKQHRIAADNLWLIRENIFH